MGNGTSRPVTPGPDAPIGASGLPPTPESTPVKKHLQLGDPLTPEMTPPRTYHPLTPPPSGRSKQLPAPDSSQDPSTPTPLRPATPSPSSSSSSYRRISPTHGRTTPSRAAFTTPCSRCHRPIPHRRPTPPRPLRCGHRLCKRCTRASLLAALSADPFVPATCCDDGSPHASASASVGTNEDAHIHLRPNDSDNGNSSMENSTGLSTMPETIGIPLAVLGEAATPAEFLAYRDKLRELRTPPAARLYCHGRARCGMFLSRPWLRPRSGTCPLCASRTCRVCGGKAHLFGVAGGVGGGSHRVEKQRKKRRAAGSRRTRNRGSAGEKRPLCQHQET